MAQLHTHSQYKSLKQGDLSGVDAGPFVVLTGPNGTGKSNVLEALHQNAVTFDDLGQLPPDQIRLFRVGELAPAVEGPVQGAQYKEPWANVYNNVNNWKIQAEQQNMPVELRRNWIMQNLENSGILAALAVTQLETHMGKEIHEAELSDFSHHAPLISGLRDPFTASIAELFLTCSNRWIMHELAQWRYERKGGPGQPPETDEEFVERFGPKPWELLDDTLRIVGLTYRFDPPPEDSEIANYEVILRDDQGNPIRVNDLSSGERVLMAVAMSLFTGSRMSSQIRLPRVLLLDEADASLHPSMIKSLLTVIQDVFVAQYNVRVVLATHSPTTVALAPEDSLYVMSRLSPRLRKTTTDEAMKLLTVGMSSLSVRLENRRQIFVESEYDQAVFQGLYALLKDRVASEGSAEFVAVGKREVGGGCDMVKRLVKDLRQAGNDTIFGIVDRDGRHGSPNHIHFMAERYSIENVILDPLLLGVFLLREQIVRPEDLGLTAGVRNFELKAADAPDIITAISTELGYGGDTRSVPYVGDFSADVPMEFLDTRGHDLEAAIVQAYQPLNKFGKNLLIEVVRRAVADVPSFTPRCAVRIFEEILS